MLTKLRQLLRAKSAPIPCAALPAGTRAYAIGDVHGRADLLAALIAAVDADDARRNADAASSPAAAPADTTMLLLGDLIDRGPDSAAALRLAQGWQQQRKVRILAGNHEEMLLGALENVEVLRHLVRHGGREMALSFGIDEQTYMAASYEELQALLLAMIPPDLLRFIRGFEDRVRLGDYVFVHAGIRPGVPMVAQTLPDMRWIREPFLSSTEDHGAVIVHGHTITPEPDLRPNRIGIDTGAYMHGRLTALGLEGTARWLISAQEAEGTIVIRQEAA